MRGDPDPMAFDGVKIFSATKQKEREVLGETITQWLEDNRGQLRIVDKNVSQSSDNAYHCLSVTFFYQRTA